MVLSVLNAFGFDDNKCQVVPFGDGLINSTWKLTGPQGDFILQRVNNSVFKQPQDIASNISLIARHFNQHYPEYNFVAPVVSQSGEAMVHIEGDGFYRMFPFVHGSHTINVVESPGQAYGAATQFGRFTKLLAGFDVGQLKITIPSFHDVELRYSQFLQSLESGNQQRIAGAGEWIKILVAHSDIAAEYAAIKLNPGFKLRVTHHDTKISNVLFDNNDKAICVIDLDTLMPGYFMSDVGDMMRTYLCPVSEEESDLTKVIIREDFYKAIVQGYYFEMKDELTDIEKAYFFYAGKMMIYMQALRFLTDYFNDDIYYGAKYAEQNFVRAKNQVVLLQRLLEKEAVLGRYLP